MFSVIFQFIGIMVYGIEKMKELGDTGSLHYSFGLSVLAMILAIPGGITSFLDLLGQWSLATIPNHWRYAKRHGVQWPTNNRVPDRLRKGLVRTLYVWIDGWMDGCMHACMHILWMYVCVYAYVCTHVCMHVCIQLHVCVQFMFVSMCVCMHACMYVCMHVCMYVCMHVYMHARMCIYILAVKIIMTSYINSKHFLIWLFIFIIECCHMLIVFQYFMLLQL